MTKITKVGVAPYSEYIKHECNAPESQDNIITIEFTSTMDIAALTTTIHAKIGPISVPYPLSGGAGDVCKTGREPFFREKYLLTSQEKLVSPYHGYIKLASLKRG